MARHWSGAHKRTAIAPARVSIIALLHAKRANDCCLRSTSARHMDASFSLSQLHTASPIDAETIVNLQAAVSRDSVDGREGSLNSFSSQGFHNGRSIHTSHRNPYHLSAVHTYDNMHDDCIQVPASASLPRYHPQRWAKGSVIVSHRTTVAGTPSAPYSTYRHGATQIQVTRPLPVVCTGAGRICSKRQCASVRSCRRDTNTA